MPSRPQNIAGAPRVTNPPDLQRLLPIVEAAYGEVEDLDFVLIGSMPLPICRSKRASRCKVREATMGYGIQGSVYGFKLRAWSTLNGKLAQYVIRPANQHDLIAGDELNAQWVDDGTPRIMGDKAYLGGCNLTPPKKNAKTVDPRWKKEYGVARKMIETVFLALTRAGIRFGQIKNLKVLHFRVALAVLAYNWRSINP